MVFCLLKSYINGYYCGNESELEVVRKETNRIILGALKDAYPLGLNAQDLVERTGLPLKTVYPQLKELNRELFINELGKQRKKRGRPLVKAPQTSEGERSSARYVIEDLGRIYDHFYSSPDEANYAMAPGNVDYPDEFIDSWHKIVTKQEQDEVCKPLLEFIKRSHRRLTESNDENVRKWTPETNLAYSLSGKEITHSPERKSQEASKNKKQKFCCSQCGINHEARDFMRATLLHLIDHLERAEGFVKFIEESEFSDKQIYDEFVKKGGKYKCEN